MLEQGHNFTSPSPIAQRQPRDQIPSGLLLYGLDREAQLQVLGLCEGTAKGTSVVPITPPSKILPISYYFFRPHPVWQT